MNIINGKLYGVGYEPCQAVVHIDPKEREAIGNKLNGKEIIILSKTDFEELLKPNDILNQLAKIKGGYTYSGASSYQLCFPLKAGGELRFSIVDDDCIDKSKGEKNFGIDLYSGELPPGITGFAESTGKE